MPFALIAIGLLLVIAAYNNTQGVLSSQLQKDFSGKTGFIYWIAAIIILGAVGYIKPMQTVSRAMLALVLVMIFLTREGFMQKLNAALGGGAGTGADGETTTTPLPEADAPPPGSKSTTESSEDAILNPENQRQINASNWGSNASGAPVSDGLVLPTGQTPPERSDGRWVLTKSTPGTSTPEAGSASGQDTYHFMPNNPLDLLSFLKPKGNMIQ